MQLAPTLQTKLAAEAQAKYERELMLHAADVEALQELKKKIGLEGAQKRELEEKVSKTCSLLQDKSTAWSALEKHLKVGPPAPRWREQNLMCRLWNRAGLHQGISVSIGIGIFRLPVCLVCLPTLVSPSEPT